MHEVAGVEHVISISIKRFDAATPGLPEPDTLEVGFDEILLVRNDPNHTERGSMADGVPAVVLRVLLEHGREAEFEAVRETIASYQRCRGPNRFSLTVEQAFLRQVWIDLRHGRDGSFVAAEVEAAVVAALAPMMWARPIPMAYSRCVRVGVAGASTPRASRRRCRLSPA